MTIRSFRKHVDGYAIAAEVRMHRQTHKGAFLVVEGGRDVGRLRDCVDESLCQYVVSFGKPNVLDAIERLLDDGILGVLGLIDADFDRILGRPLNLESIVVSEYHDFDLDMVHTQALARYLLEVAEPNKLSASGGTYSVLSAIVGGISALSIMRFVNEKYGLRFSLKNLQFEDFFDGTNIDLPALLNHVVASANLNSTEAKQLEELTKKYMDRSLDAAQLTSGHDFCAALGIALRDKLGRRKTQQTYGSEVELHLRLAYRLVDFASTQVHREISDWEAKNAPYRVLRAA